MKNAHTTGWANYHQRCTAGNWKTLVYRCRSNGEVDSCCRIVSGKLRPHYYLYLTVLLIIFLDENIVVNVLQIRSEFSDNGPGTQTLTISNELKRRGINVVLCSSGGQLTEKILEQKFKYYLVPEMAYSRRGIFNVLKSISAIRRILLDENIDVVHGHNAASIFMANVASIFSTKKIAFFQSVRGLEVRKRYFFRNWIYKVIRFDSLFTVSEFTKKKLASFGVPNEKLVVTYNGTDLNRFDISKVAEYKKEIRSEFGVPDDALLVGIIGRQDGYKGHRDLLKVFAELYSSYENLYVMLVGHGDELGKNIQLANDLKIQDRVIFTGLRIDVERFHAAFDIFTLLSKKGLEMFPNVIVEAMTYQVPFLSVNTTGIPEMAQNNEGIICECADLDCYKESIVKLVDDPNLRSEMGHLGRKSVLERFNINSIVDKIETTYQTALQ
jgi:glycosyltransferase involved in cell wall biosynthesis